MSSSLPCFHQTGHRSIHSCTETRNHPSYTLLLAPTSSDFHTYYAMRLSTHFQVTLLFNAPVTLRFTLEPATTNVASHPAGLPQSIQRQPSKSPSGIVLDTSTSNVSCAIIHSASGSTGSNCGYPCFNEHDTICSRRNRRQCCRSGVCRIYGCIRNKKISGGSIKRQSSKRRAIRGCQSKNGSHLRSGQVSSVRRCSSVVAFDRIGGICAALALVTALFAIVVANEPAVV